MKRTTKAVVGIAAVLSLGIAAGAYAHTGMGQGMGHGMSQGQGMGHGMGQGQGMGHGMGQGHGRKGGMGSGAMMRGGSTGPMAGNQLMTAEERTAQREKMQAATTPEERRAIAEGHRAEMEKRAKDKGVTLPGATHQH